MGMFSGGDLIANEECFYDAAEPAVLRWGLRDKPWIYRIAIERPYV